jgi:hypothetical protein
MPSPGKLLSWLRTGAAAVLPRVMYRRYMSRAAGRLCREFDARGGPDRMERSIRRAVNKVARRSSSLRIQDIVLGGAPLGSGFNTMLEAIGHELPQVLRDDYPGSRFGADKQVSRRFVRAMRAAVAGSADDAVAQRILNAQGPAERIRSMWLPLTVSVTSGTLVGVAADLGIKAASHRPVQEAVGVGFLAFIFTGVTGVGAFGARQGDLVVDAQLALRGLVDALLGPNVPEYKLMTPQQRFEPTPVAPVVAGEVKRILKLLGAETSTPDRGPPSQEVLYRWDGDECGKIEAALEKVALALGKLHPADDWKAPGCVVNTATDVLRACADPDHEVFEVQLEVGSSVFKLLVCCAAVANVLDTALDLNIPMAA